jgi:hypothetical protein
MGREARPGHTNAQAPSAIEWEIDRIDLARRGKHARDGDKLTWHALQAVYACAYKRDYSAGGLRDLIPAEPLPGF